MRQFKRFMCSAEANAASGLKVTERDRKSERRDLFSFKDENLNVSEQETDQKHLNKHQRDENELKGEKHLYTSFI